MRTSLSLLAIVIGSGPLCAQEQASYARDIKPLFKERCYSCHGGLKQKGGLRLDTAALVRQGGDSGPAVAPGQAAGSLLLERVAAKEKRMPPPSEGEPLTGEQIAKLKAWIDQGAKGPAVEKAEEDPRRHWAFRVPVRPPLPAVKDAAWKRNPIDAFIAADHEKLGLTPRQEASRPVLLRRVYLDLIGLPPTRAELQAFLADTSPDAYEKVVDRLLASPHHGERWGRHWMDVWRYSDWYGRAVPDVWNSAPQIWRWRDWIIQSLNADKGYNRMVQEMLAADEIAPENDQAAVATGYIVRNWYALNPHQWMRDMVEHTGKAFLGLTFNCAHCHDHKYDPIAHEDYFRFRAFFEPVQLRQDRIAGEGDPGPFQKYDYSVLRKVVKIGSVRVFDEKLDAKTFMYLQGDERLKVEGKPALAPGVPAFLGKVTVEPVSLPASASYPGIKPFVHQEEIARCEKQLADARSFLEKARTGAGKKDVPRALQLAETRHASAESEVKSVQARIAADNAMYKKSGKPDELARAASVAERQLNLARAREKSIQAQHDLELAQQKATASPAGKEKDQAALVVKKAETQAAVLKKAVEQAEKATAVVDGKYTPFSPTYPVSSTGRRRALAQWIASRDNPLTARVAVNHIWMRHFDRPLVETVFDFGRNGKRPSHPELLDWLAVELMDKNWSMRHLHRLIVTSAAYRLESASGAESPNLARDADNKHLWRFNARRLEAELVRDGLLYLSGDLDKAIGGPVLENSQELTSKRRSLYFSVFPEDGGHLKFLEIFDAPDPCDCYRRTDSVLPQQALALANNQLAVNQGRLLARKLWADGNLAKDDPMSEPRFVTAAFEQVLGRAPTAQEQTLCREFLARQMELYRQAKPPSAPSVNGMVAPSSDPAMRARESLVRTLFNHNDFVTIR